MQEYIKNITITILLLYFIFIISLLIPITQFGIIPRSLKGLIGIITSPFLHANFSHLVANTFPLITLLFVLYSFYPKKAFSVIVISILLAGALVWLFGRSANHIGASGLIYALVGFLIANGFSEQKLVPLLISIGIAIIYSSFFFGIFPSLHHPYISWEGHLFGAISGTVASFLLKYK
ncbi:MAG: membrane associated rhomboid family serine protease [Polaribacter sp.]|jgi:membrane associated rhomboid family serine protease